MLMCPGYYVIKPNAAFKERLTMKKIDTDLAGILSEISFWTHNKVNIIEKHPESDIAQVKLLFLASLMSDYLSNNLYQDLLEQSDISLEVFDKWWGVERYLLDEDFKDVEKRITPSIASCFTKTGIGRVDFCIDEMQRFQ